MRFLRRLLHIVTRGRRDAELREEMQFHLAMKQRELEAAGFSSEVARDASRRALGNVTYNREASHAVWVPPDIESFWRDVPYAFRSLRRSPSFTIAAVLALGLGIGSAAAVFSLLDGVVLRPLPYRDPERLVMLWEVNPAKNLGREGLSPVNLLDYRNLPGVFDDVAGREFVEREGIGVDGFGRKRLPLRVHGHNSRNLRSLVFKHLICHIHVAEMLPATVSDCRHASCMLASPRDPWSGQIAFPGGREEAGDTSLAQTAVRETREETGIDLEREGMLVGTLDDLRPRTVRLPAIIVRPFVALLDRNEPLELSSEVALAFWIPFGALSRPDSWHEDTVFARGIQINARVFRHQDHVIWGMTERILAQLLALLTT